MLLSIRVALWGLIYPPHTLSIPIPQRMYTGTQDSSYFKVEKLISVELFHFKRGEIGGSD